MRRVVAPGKLSHFTVELPAALQGDVEAFRLRRVTLSDSDPSAIHDGFAQRRASSPRRRTGFLR